MTPDNHEEDGTTRRHSTGDDSPLPNDDLWLHLRCPYCRGALGRRGDGAVCRDCGDEYPTMDGGTLDLRLRRSKSVSMTFEVDDLPSVPEFPFRTTPPSDGPDIDFSGVELPRRLPASLASHIPRAEGPDALALDLGCGQGIHREVIEHAGYRWVGLDIDPTAATVVGDGQALPFADDTFDLLLSLKVLAQTQNPFVVLAEANRVLKPGGTFVGNVASNEPFTGVNTFNMTPLGLYDALRQAGFETELVIPGWDALTAQAMMGRFPLLPSPLAKALVAPLRAASRLWYGLGSLVVDHEKTGRTFRRFNATAELHFVARATGSEREATSVLEAVEASAGRENGTTGNRN